MNQEKQYIKIANLIASELNGSINEEDRKYLHNWLNKSIENKNIYNKIKKDGWYQSHLKTNHKYSIEEGWNKINPRIQSTSKIIKLAPKIWKYIAAAVVIGIFATTYFLRNNVFNTSVETSPVIVNTIVPGTDKAVLTLEDGSVIELDKGNTYKTQNANSNGEQIVYEVGELHPTEIVYNYLTIPRGGQFFIKLSDGTQVWLNSESQLKYPVSFKEGETRRVELIYGEAYFDVSPSSEHKGSKFMVFNQFQEVEVLGTEFNIKAYKDETNVYTTLIEGKVAIGNGISKQNLEPNQQSILDLEMNKITIANVDVKVETSWRNGVFSFKGKPLKEIMRVIARWYDVNVVFENKDLELVRFKGILDKRQSIEEILSIMKSNSINNYEINEKTIILK